MVSNFKFLLFLYIRVNPLITFYLIMSLFVYITMILLLCLVIMFIIIFILLFYSNGNHYMTLNILLKGFESIHLIIFRRSL